VLKLLIHNRLRRFLNLRPARRDGGFVATDVFVLLISTRFLIRWTLTPSGDRGERAVGRFPRILWPQFPKSTGWFPHVISAFLRIRCR